MKYELEFHPDALTDVCKARCWCDAYRAGQGDRIERAFFELVVQIAKSPERFPIVHDPYRRAKVKGFPFGVLFALRGERVIILGLHHDRQDIEPFLHRS
jgi:hypothetical protein